MNLEQLQSWILSSDGMQSELHLLSRYAVAKSIDVEVTEHALKGHEPDWRRLLFAASILSKSELPVANESALLVAQAGLQHSAQTSVANACAALLTQISNHRAIQLAVDRELINSDFEDGLGVAEQMLITRRALEQSVFPINHPAIVTNRFQREFWEQLNQAAWVSASAPTASGKTYLVLQWLLSEFARKRAKIAVFLAPTRALVGEIERNLLDLAPDYSIEGLRIASLPLAALGDMSRPTILVFTQERLHVFLNSTKTDPKIDIAITDEVQKLGDGLRGVILQDAIERIVRTNRQGKLIFLSPMTENPETLLEDAPQGLQTAVVPSDIPTVTQNVLMAEQFPRRSSEWRLSLRHNGTAESLGKLTLHAKPDNQIKRLSFVALALGRKQVGTLIYANGAAQAEKIAWQIYNGLASEFTSETNEGVDEELTYLSDFARDTVHPKFQLVDLVKRGVAFHYGNMPTLLRSEIERLFTDGKLRFLICTSTLVEGVNLACRTIVVRGPKKGLGKHMGPHDFWNLAGRAGRWGQDFSGNIVCVDVTRSDLWPNGVPERSRYPINRETDTVLTHRKPMLDYLDTRQSIGVDTIDPSLEQVSAYLLAWRAREGTITTAPSASRLPNDYVKALDGRLAKLLDTIDIPSDVISRHPGVSAVALQSLLAYFRKRSKPVEELVPSSPESDDAYQQLIAVFYRINKHLYPAFQPRGAIPIHALVTVEWMRGLPLGQIIRGRIAYLEKKGQPYKLPTVIRDTMRDVEEVARFRAPKYLAAYLDVLKHHLHEIGAEELFPADLRFDLFLEFGVATQTLLSLIGLGLSRTTSVAINEFLADDKMDEDAVFAWLEERSWEGIDVPGIVKKELDRLVARRARLASVVSD